MNPQIRAFVGGRSFVQFYLKFVKIHFFFDVVGIDINIFDYFLSLDVVNYRQVCQELKWDASAMQL